MWRFWDIREYLTEGREWLRALLADEELQAHTPQRAKAVRGAGSLARTQKAITTPRRRFILKR